MWEPILAQMYPNKVALLEDAWSLFLVDLGDMASDMCFNCLACVFMQVLYEVGLLGDVHVDALVKWEWKKVKCRWWVETIDDLEGALLGDTMFSAVVGELHMRNAFLPRLGVLLDQHS
jgi:hypothetical protein